MDNSWIVDNLTNALNTWNDKLGEIWQLLTVSPVSYNGGTVWSVMTGIHGALQAIAYGLLVLFKAGTRPKAVCEVCPCQSSCGLRSRPDAGGV